MAILRSDRMTKPKPRRLSAHDIEHALAHRIGFRKYTICPNVHWGLDFRHELDLLVLTPGDWAWEIEIKISVSDLKRDLKKKRHHTSDRIRCLFFAVPKRMQVQALEFAPAEAGIWVVDEATLSCDLVRQPKRNQNARKFNSFEKFDLVRLASMRLWDRRPFPTADTDFVGAVMDVIDSGAVVVMGSTGGFADITVVTDNGILQSESISKEELEQSCSRKQLLIASIRECTIKVQERQGDCNGSIEEGGSENGCETGQERHTRETGEEREINHPAQDTGSEA